MGQASMRKWVRRALDRHPDLAAKVLTSGTGIRAVLEQAHAMRLEHRNARRDATAMRAGIRMMGGGSVSVFDPIFEATP